MTREPRTFPARADDALSTKQAFDAMLAFLEAFWKRGGQPDDSMADLLSWASSGMMADEGPNDPAMWSDWLDAIDACARRQS